jgi:protein phosphatase 1G
VYKLQYYLAESYAGCTANVALIHKNTLYVANAGDSRTVLCRNGSAFEMSVDHKPDNPEEFARIDKAGGYIAEGRVNGNHDNLE